MILVKKNLQYLILCIAPIFLLSGCFFKTNSDKHWTLLTKEGRTWHVDKMIITTVNISNSPDYVERIDTILDPGDFTFEGSNYESDDCIVKFDGHVKLNPNYSEHFGPFEAKYYNAGASIIAELNPIVNGTTIYLDMVYLKKDKLRLYTPRELNPFFTQIHDFNFTFECTRK